MCTRRRASVFFFTRSLIDGNVNTVFLPAMCLTRKLVTPFFFHFFFFSLWLVDEELGSYVSVLTVR